MKQLIALSLCYHLETVATEYFKTFDLQNLDNYYLCVICSVVNSSLLKVFTKTCL